MKAPGTAEVLWRHRTFRLYLAGQTSSVAGSSISQVAIPLLAVLHLDAGAGEVALLAFTGQLPPALLALHAGALADRRSKRTQMMLSDLVSAAALACVPVAAATGTLTLPLLMTVAAVQGAAQVVHDAAAISYLPELVDRSLLQRGNARIGAVFAVAGAAGNHLGAALSAAVGPARALTGDVVSYLVSIWCTARIRSPRPAPRAPAGAGVTAEIRDGLHYVRQDHTLLTLTLVNATVAVGLGVLVTLWPLYALRHLAMSGAVFGIILGAGALGAATGALLAPRLAERFGPGPMMLTALALTPLAHLPLLCAGPGAGWQTVLGIAQFVQLACAGAAGVTQRTIRQLAAEPAMQARMQAVSTWLCAVARPLAALAAGALGTWAGIRPALAAGAILLAVPFLVLARSPLRGLRRMPGAPDPTDTPSPSGGDPMTDPLPAHRVRTAIPPPGPRGAAESGTGPERTP
ncbi:MFS transporter [Streptomyces sp. NPDC057638]|uniref:MFS transporter n=1 Tax=Streptomyces sp. NPDC057638 TaxID=3346190 RepID=UPI00367752CD